MININNKSWEQLSFSDIEAFLVNGEESTFFEFKEDRETNEKLIKEIVAFSNTYGGYIFLGINDKKEIAGCSAWDEQRIHATIHDSIIPTPIFDTKKLTRADGTVVYVIKIEEGPLPPYVNSKGQIFERLSSGSFPVKDSGKLTLFYNKHADAINKIKNKIELPELVFSNQLPHNFCGYLDMGFSLVCSEMTALQKHPFDYDFSQVVEYLKSIGLAKFSISRVGEAYQISFGDLSLKDNNGNEQLIDAGLNNYIEIMRDGSIRCRIFLSANVGTSIVPIYRLIVFNSEFQNIYRLIFEQDLGNSFIYAQKYIKLTVIKQFVPVFGVYKDHNTNDCFQPMSDAHNDKYGGNLVIIGNRIPWNGYEVIDKRYLTDKKIAWSVDNLLRELFDNKYHDLGFIDLGPLKTISEKQKEKEISTIKQD